LMFEMSGDDSIWKRRLRMELAAEVGAPELAAELDKRLASLAASRVRVSWRKRPDVIRDLRSLHHMITERLAPLDKGLALDRLLDWFALFPSLRSRVKDPKHELSGLFDAASSDLWQAAGAAHAEGLPAAERLAEAIARRPVDWAGWLDARGQALDPNLAGDLLKTMRPPGE